MLDKKNVKQYIDGTFPDPIYERDGSWYWTDEGYEEHGPCKSEQEAVDQQWKYADQLYLQLANQRGQI